jgi:hypothetical protein
MHFAFKHASKTVGTPPILIQSSFIFPLGDEESQKKCVAVEYYAPSKPQLCWHTGFVWRINGWRFDSAVAALQQRRPSQLPKILFLRIVQILHAISLQTTRLRMSRTRQRSTPQWHRRAASFTAPSHRFWSLLTHVGLPLTCLACCGTRSIRSGL